LEIVVTSFRLDPKDVEEIAPIDLGGEIREVTPRGFEGEIRETIPRKFGEDTRAVESDILVIFGGGRRWRRRPDKIKGIREFYRSFQRVRPRSVWVDLSLP
jgi:hypothetical protein